MGRHEQTKTTREYMDTLDRRRVLAQ